MAKVQKFYAVRKGRQPGIYTSWAECQKQITGFSGASYKSFLSQKEADDFLHDDPVQACPDISPEDMAVAYVDGSYEDRLQKFACGVVFFYRGREEHFSEGFSDPLLLPMRNVAGEIKGAMLAMQLCLDRDILGLTIYYDYEGIAKWPSGEWKANKEGTAAYRDFYRQASQKISICFCKVKGHSGDRYNELADQLAKAGLLK